MNPKLPMLLCQLNYQTPTPNILIFSHSQYYLRSNRNQNVSLSHSASKTF